MPKDVHYLRRTNVWNLILNTLLKQSSKSYVNTGFSSAEGSRTFGAFGLF